MKSDIFSGTIPALMTPCKADRSPDFDTLVAKAKELVGLGMSAVVYCGSMGDWPLLTTEQRMEGVERLVKAGIKVVVGTGAVNTATAAALTASTAALTTVLNRLGFDRRIHFVTRGFDARDLFLQQALDVAQQLVLVHADQRERFTGCRRAAGTADTVNVIFRHVRQLVVDDVRQLFDIQPTRRDIRRHHDLCQAVTKSV